MVALLQVFEEDRERLAVGSSDQESRDRIEQPESRLLSVQWWRFGDLGHPLAYFGDDLCDLECARAQVRSYCLGVVTACMVADHLHPRPVGRSTCGRIAASPQNLRAPQGSICRGLRCKPRLTDPRLTTYQHSAAAAAHGVIDRCAELVCLPLSPEERSVGDPVERRYVVSRGIAPADLSGDQPKRIANLGC